MSGDIIAVIMGLTALIVFAGTSIRIRKIRAEGRRKLIDEYGGEEERMPVIREDGSEKECRSSIDVFTEDGRSRG